MSSASPVTSVKRPAVRSRLRAATLADYPQISALERRFGIESHTYEDWSHLWLANPVYRELQRDWSIGWVLEDSAHRIVGTMSNIPLAYEFERRRLLVATGRSWVVEPEYRSLSLQLLDPVVNQPGIDLYLNTTVGENSIGSMSVFDCPRVPSGIWDRSAFWVTHPGGFVESVLVSSHGKWLRPVAYPLAAALWIRDLGSRARKFAREVQSCTGFDDRFDEFWDRLRSANPAVLLAVRSREMLDWHFRHALRANRLWIGAVMDGRAIRAYAIFDRNDNRKSGMTRVRLLDFQSLDGDHLLRPLLAWALDRCRSEKIHVLESAGRWLEPGGLIHKLAPYHRKLISWTYFYRAANHTLAQKLKRPEAWAPWLYDGDASF